MFLMLAWPAPAASPGPLRVLERNPRYFTADGVRAVYFTGAHTWHNLQDCGRTDPPEAFDYDRYLEDLVRWNHNFVRLWTWENTAESCWSGCVLTCRPMAFARTGPGPALDGKPKFDTSRFDEEFFGRIRDRVRKAGALGIYVGVVLFQGFSVAKKETRAKGSPWPSHPFHRDNNVNGIDGDPNRDGNGYEVHTLGDPRILAIQEAYVRKVVDAVGDAPNVIFEISNESHGAATPWLRRMADVIRRYEANRKFRHPVWISFQHDGVAGPGTNEELFRGPSEAVSPRIGGVPEFPSDPQLADGSKVVLLDSDHFIRLDWSPVLVWKAFLRGTNPLLMDTYRRNGAIDAKWDAVRAAMGETRRWAERFDLARMVPTDREAECSTRFCLREPGKAYLVLQPGEGAFTLRVTAGKYRYQWLDPATGRSTGSGTIELEGGARRFEPPAGGGAVLCLHR